MRLSLIMCTRNRMNELLRFNESLISQSRLPDEYIIVDSSDLPLDQIPTFQNKMKKIEELIQVHYIHSEKGLTKQRNIGVKSSTGDLLFFFDDDIILHTDFLKEIETTFHSSSEYWGGMGNITNEFQREKVLGFKKTLIEFLSIGYKIFHLLFLLEGGSKSGRFTLSGFTNLPHGRKDFTETECLSGGLTAYRKEVFQEFKFDEMVTGYSYMEDVDFSRRVSFKYKLFYNPKAMCEHWHGEGGRGDLVENRKGYMCNYRYFYFKNIYSRNKSSILAHWWSVFGLFIEAIPRGVTPLKISKIWKGYILGLIEFKKNKFKWLKESS